MLSSITNKASGSCSSSPTIQLKQENNLQQTTTSIPADLLAVSGSFNNSTNLSMNNNNNNNNNLNQSFDSFGNNTRLALNVNHSRQLSYEFNEEQDTCLQLFDKWSPVEQVEFAENLLRRMCHFQHGHINNFLKPMLQRDFISSLPAKGLLSIAEIILSYLDAKSLCAAELVCKEWLRVISEGMLWKKLIERQVLSDPMWKGLSQHRGWAKYLFKNNLYFNQNANSQDQHKFYKDLYVKIIKDKEVKLFFYFFGFIFIFLII